MKVSYVKGLANHSDPESCLDVPQGRGEALTGERAGRVSSREILLRGADVVKGNGRPHPARRQRKTRRDPARSQTPGMHGSDLRGTREILRPAVVVDKDGPRREALGRTPMMDGRRKSDGLIVPRNLSNKLGIPGTERGEGRGPTKGNSADRNILSDTAPNTVCQVMSTEYVMGHS